MKVLRPRAYYNPEQTPSTYLDRDLCETMSENGIVYVNYTPTPTRGVTKKTHKEYSKSAHKTEHLYDGHVIINRFRMFREGKNPIQRAIRYLICSIREYQLCTRENNVDVVYSSSTPPIQGMLSALIAGKLCKRYGRHVPFVYNLQDIFPDSMINAGMIKKNGLIWNIGRKIEDFTYNRAEKIIVISENFKQNIIAKGVPESKVAIIPNWADVDNVHPVERNDNVLFERYQLDPKGFYICYSGNIGHSQNFGHLIEVAQIMEQKIPNVFFVIIGEGAAKEWVAECIDSLKLKNIILLPFQPYEDIAHVFSLGDVDLIISKPGIGGSSVPSKTWSIFASKRPVLCSFDLDSELSKLVCEEKCGLTVAPGDKAGFIQAITQLMSDSKLCNQMGENGFCYLTRELNKNKCCSEYVDTLYSVIR